VIWHLPGQPGKPDGDHERLQYVPAVIAAEVVIIMGRCPSASTCPAPVLGPTT
jgi:hypothetical protein